jgi:hypothetical protein
MKARAKLAFFLLFVSLLALQTPLSHAQSINPEGVTFSASGVPTMDCPQGANGSVEVWVENNGTEAVNVTLVSAYFNWSGLNVFNLTFGSAVHIDIGDELLIGKVNFSVPMDATIGYHNYYLIVEFTSQGQPHTWQSEDKLVWIADYYEEPCDQALSTAAFKLVAARDAVNNAQSTIQSIEDPQNQEGAELLAQAQSKLEEAQTHLAQAENTFDNATTHYNSQEYQTAYTLLQECANLADSASASATEASNLAAQIQQSSQQQEQTQQLILYGIIIAVIAVALTVIIIIIKRR